MSPYKACTVVACLQPISCPNAIHTVRWLAVDTSTSTHVQPTVFQGSVAGLQWFSGRYSCAAECVTNHQNCLCNHYMTTIAQEKNNYKCDTSYPIKFITCLSVLRTPRHYVLTYEHCIHINISMVIAAKMYQSTTYDITSSTSESLLEEKTSGQPLEIEPTASGFSCQCSDH